MLLQFILVYYDIHRVDNAAAVSTSKAFGDIGEVFVQHRYIVNEIISLATVTEKVFST